MANKAATDTVSEYRYWVDERSEIEALLYQLMTQQAALLAVNREVGKACRTAIVQIDAESDLLHFDELMPIDANRWLLPDHPIRLHGWLDGVRISFTADIIDTRLIDEKGHYFSTRFPEKLRYPQRREQYRIRIQPAAVPVSASITYGGDERLTIDSDIVDLSVGGVGLILEDEPDIAISDEISCLLRMPDTSLKLRLEVCSRAVLEKPTRTRIGTRFVDISASTHATVQRFIAAVQREQLRRR